MKISAVILAKNEENRIGGCLESLAWTDEQIVIDNGSRDQTIAVAKKKGAKVIEAKSKSFSDLRNLGKKEAKGDWIFYIDADETVTEELAKEIKRNILQTKVVAYIERRKNYYLGHPWPFQEKILRLFRKSALIEWYGDLHESPRVEGEVGELSTPLLHDTHRTLEEMVVKTNEWSEVEAILRLRSGHPPVVWWRFFRVMATAFYDSFITQSGWRAGTVGWVESIYQSFSIFITYAKLWEKQQQKRD